MSDIVLSKYITETCLDIANSIPNRQNMTTDELADTLLKQLTGVLVGTYEIIVPEQYAIVFELRLKIASYTVPEVMGRKPIDVYAPLNTSSCGELFEVCLDKYYRDQFTNGKNIEFKYAFDALYELLKHTNIYRVQGSERDSIRQSVTTQYIDNRLFYNMKNMHLPICLLTCATL